MAKWALTADWHFDVYPRLSTFDSEGLTSRLRDQITSWAWMVDTAAEKGCTGLVVLGDIFNSRTEIDVAVLDVVCELFEYAATKLKDVRILPGNHDSYLKNARRNSLKSIAAYATIYAEPSIAAPFAFVPWVHDGDVLKANVAQIAKQGKGKVYLCAHTLVAGAVPAHKGIPINWLQPSKFRGVFLGDVHDPKVLSNKVRYVGSPMQIDYRDAGQQRGFYVLDDAKYGLEYVENDVSPRFHILSNPEAVEDVTAKDFVRVKTEDDALAVKTEEAAKAVTKWVESTHVEIDDTPPRIAVRAKDSDADVLKRYVEYTGVKGGDDLVELGCDIMAEVEGS
jgi:DNA repair exonuclease SbcCD nuclease subunit